MRCKDCKYFRNVANEKYSGLGHECKNDKFIYEAELDLESDDRLSYWDYEGYMAGFAVGPNFGCIHFEKAENPDE